MSGFPPGGGPDPPHSAPQGGYAPPCWQKKLKSFPNFTVIFVKIDHFKHQNLKTFLVSWGSAPRPPPLLDPHLSNIPGTKCEIFSAPPSPVEINNLPATNTPAPPPPWESNGGPLRNVW